MRVFKGSRKQLAVRKLNNGLYEVSQALTINMIIDKFMTYLVIRLSVELGVHKLGLPTIAGIVIVILALVWFLKSLHMKSKIINQEEFFKELEVLNEKK